MEDFGLGHFRVVRGGTEHGLSLLRAPSTSKMSDVEECQVLGRSGHDVRIGHLPPGCTVQQLTRGLCKYGPVQTVEIAAGGQTAVATCKNSRKARSLLFHLERRQLPWRKLAQQHQAHVPFGQVQS